MIDDDGRPDLLKDSQHGSGFSDCDFSDQDYPDQDYPDQDYPDQDYSALDYPEEALVDNKRVLKGRGAISNPANRYHPHASVGVDDGWPGDDDSTPTPTSLSSSSSSSTSTSVPTKLIAEQSRTIISSNKSPDIPFNKSINPYRGCEHGCVYCYARPTHAYWDMSPGLDFETKIIVRSNAAVLLEQSLNRPGYRCEPICIGSNTDPYQPTERSERITHSVLEVLQRYRHPFSMITKGELILRDLDILTDMAKDNLCSIAISLTTLSNETKRKLEPRTASPAARLRVIEQLSKAGVHVTVLAAPIIPVINDHELEEILAAASNAGAKNAAYIFLRLPLEIDTLFTEWLQEHYPDRAGHVLSIVRQSRGGKTYESQFHTRMRGRGVFADLLHQRFQLATKKLGFNLDSSRYDLDLMQFKKQNEQLSLF